MIQRDILQDQIKELARVLSTILGEFIGYKTSGEIQDGIQKTSTHLKTQLDIDLNILLDLSNEDMSTYLTDRKMKIGHFEMLAKYLMEIGQAKMIVDKTEAKIYLQKSIEILELENNASETLCLNRLNLKTKVELILQELE